MMKRSVESYILIGPYIEEKNANLSSKALEPPAEISEFAFTELKKRGN